MGWELLPVRTKDEPERDEYVLWSSTLDAPVGHGTRKTINRQMIRAGWGDTEEAFYYADLYGTSAAINLGHIWDKDLRLGNGPGAGSMLPREHLREYLELVDRGGMDAERRASTLTTPFPDEEVS